MSGWVYGPGGGSTSPGGSNGDIQFNSSGSFSGSALLTTDGAGSLSASANISASAFYGDGSNLTNVTASAVEVADGPQYSLQFRYDSPVSGDLSGSANFVVSSDMSKLFLTGTLIASSSTGNPAQFEGLVLVTSPEGELVVRDTTNNKQIRATANLSPTLEFGNSVSDTSEYFYIQGGATSKIIVKSNLNAFIISDTTAGTEGITYKPTQARVGINTPTPSHAFTVNGDTYVTGAISASVGISSSQVEVGSAFVGDVSANGVVVGFTNGQLISHGNFTFASDVLSVPTITASVGIDVTSSANGSINIGEGIKYTFGGIDYLDVFRGDFRLRQTTYYKALSPEQTTNFQFRNYQTFIVNCTGSAITGSLPDISTADDIGMTFTVKDLYGSGSTNNIHITSSATPGHLIDGGNALKIQTDYGAVTLTALSSSRDGYGWGIVSTT